MKSIELERRGDKSLVAVIREDGTIKEFVSCSYYDSKKAFGNQWVWGHYFNGLDGAFEYFTETTKEG